MEFFVYETGETIHARRRPIVVITSNNEKELPDAFLRRCFFHYIRFPDPDTMRAIVDVHFPGIKHRLVAEALKLFYEIREVPGLKKKPSTSELLDWLKLLMVEDIGPETLRERDPKKLIPPLHGALIKNEQDVHLFERLAFMARRDGRWRMLRIAVGGFLHESATFVDRPTTWEDFARTGPWPGACEGQAMLDTLDGLNIGISGFIDEARSAGHTIVPVAWGMAQPAGPVTAHAFERMSATLVDGYRRSGADVIFVELHGAMVADEFDDAEGELLRRIRAVAGPDVPIVGTLDLHVNMSDLMVATTNLLSAYRTYPHVDWGETGRRVARWLDRALAWGPRPGKAMRRMPFLIPVTAGCSLISPAKELYETLEAIEAETGVHLNFTPGFPPADIVDCGPAVFGSGADQPAVQRAVDRLAHAVIAPRPAVAA